MTGGEFDKNIADISMSREEMQQLTEGGMRVKLVRIDLAGIDLSRLEFDG